MTNFLQEARRLLFSFRSLRSLGAESAFGLVD